MTEPEESLARLRVVLEDTRFSPEQAVEHLLGLKKSSTFFPEARLTAAVFVAENMQDSHGLGPRFCRLVELLLKSQVLEVTGLLRMMEEMLTEIESEPKTRPAQTAGGGSGTTLAAEEHAAVLDTLLQVCPQVPLPARTKKLAQKYRKRFPRLAQNLIVPQVVTSGVIDGEVDATILDGHAHAGGQMFKNRLSCSLHPCSRMWIPASNSGSSSSSSSSSRLPFFCVSYVDSQTLLTGTKNAVCQFDVTAQLCTDIIPCEDFSVVSLAHSKLGDRASVGLVSADGRTSAFAQLWRDTQQVWQVEMPDKQTTFERVTRSCFLGDAVCLAATTLEESLLLIQGERELRAARQVPLVTPAGDLVALDPFCLAAVSRAPAASLMLFDIREKNACVSEYSMAETDLTCVAAVKANSQSPAPTSILCAGDGCFQFDARKLERGPQAGRELIGTAIRLHPLRLPNYCALLDSSGVYSFDVNTMEQLEPAGGGKRADASAANSSFCYDLAVCGDAIFASGLDGVQHYRAQWSNSGP
ncbi:unnamed protein product [Amoebophrya sp. A120]|nr:unnamed protein product [Amoebophrya sp. A120]|eukprot:GSA120T00005345001.1